MKYFNSGDITPRQIQLFLTAAETENFSETATKLNVTQPYVSNAIGRLERTLEFPLFVRQNKKLQLTEAGRILYEEWKNIFPMIGQAVDKAYQHYMKQNDVFRIALIR